MQHRSASYISLNLSCPNAKGGKDFFAQLSSIVRLLERLASINILCPVFLKIAPRDDAAEHERVLAECEEFSWLRGFCFNLPPGKPDALQITTPVEHFAHLPGAVAGRPVEQLINRCIAGFYAGMDQKRYVLVGTGGVFSAEVAYHKIRLGASRVQLYTALVYEGPGVARRICLGLAELLGHFTIAFTVFRHQHATRLLHGQVSKVPKFIVQTDVFHTTRQISRRLYTINAIVP